MASSLEISSAARLALLMNKPTASMYQTVAQSIPNNTTTPITFGSAVGDNWTGWSSGSPSQYTVRVAGTYLVTGMVSFSGNATGVRISLLLYNGAQIAGSEVQLSAINASLQCVQSSVLVQGAVVGDYFQLGSYQSSGAALNTTVASSPTSSMTIEWLRF